ncbi:MAG: plasma-membrane proton-efflux P-type ATPase [Thermoplasmata archaeon]
MVQQTFSQNQKSDGKKSLKTYEKDPWENVAKELNTNISKGLDNEEVSKRLSIYGRNEVPEKKVNPVLKFLKKFWGTTAWLLELTIIVSYFLQKYIDMYIIFSLLLLNAVISFVQEQKAQNALELLKKQLQVFTRVLRNGKWAHIEAKELVPGDIISVREGDFVPADVKIFEGKVEVDQSALTGESQTVFKEVDNILYSGSIIKHGESTGIVIFTGVDTYFGKTTELVQTAAPKLHMESVISSVVKWLLVIVSITLSITIIVSYLRGVNLISILPLLLILLVSAIPVALPAMFTVTMALGSLELAKKGILITRLSSSEDAASMDTLCTDKTGTITTNKLQVKDVVSISDESIENIAIYGALASKESTLDAIDLAFINHAKELKLDIESYKQKQYIPFSPSKRSTEAIIEHNNTTFKVSKGAVNELIKRTNVDEDLKSKIYKIVDEFATKGFRTLAVSKEYEGKEKMIGLVSLYDAPRKDSAQMVKELNELGVSVKMLTGDAEPVAKEIASEVGIGNKVVKVSQIKDQLKNMDEEAIKKVNESEIFAEIYPEDKYFLVKTLQKNGHMVGMTGDGVNDAPALKQAEVGIAVHNATDVAKGAASVVLTTEGLAKIVDFVKTGRRIYQRIVTWILNKIIKTFQIVLFVSIAFLLLGKFIVSAFDVVLLLFLVDFVTISLSTDNVRWSKKPDKWEIYKLTKISVLMGIAVVVESMLFLYIGMYQLGITNLDMLQTYSFEIIFFAGLFTIFVVRERGHFWKSMPSSTLLIAIIADILLVIALSTVGFFELAPIPIMDTLAILGISFLFSLIINDYIKYYMARKMNLGW